MLQANRPDAAKVPFAACPDVARVPFATLIVLKVPFAAPAAGAIWQRHRCVTR